MYRFHAEAPISYVSKPFFDGPKVSERVCCFKMSACLVFIFRKKYVQFFISKINTVQISKCAKSNSEHL